MPINAFTAVATPIDSGDPLDITKDLTTSDLIRYTVPTGGPFITGAPQSNTLTEGQEVLLSPLAAIAANTLSNPMTAADVILFKEVSESAQGGVPPREVVTATANQFVVRSRYFSHLSDTGAANGDTVVLPDLTAYVSANEAQGQIHNISGQTLTLDLATNGLTAIGGLLDLITKTPALNFPDNWVLNYRQTGPGFIDGWVSPGLGLPTATYTGLQRIGNRYRPAEFEIVSSSFVSGLDLTRLSGSLMMQFTDSGETGRPWPIAEIDLEEIRENGQFFVWNHDNSYVTGTVTDYATGAFTLIDTNRAARFIYAEVVDFAENGYVIPTARDVLTPRTLTITTPSGAVTDTIFDEKSTGRILLTPSAGKQFVTTPTAQSGLSTVVVRPSGQVVAISDGTGPATLTLAEEDQTDPTPIVVPEFTQDAGVWFSIPGIPELELNLGSSGDRQLYARFLDRDHFVESKSTYSQTQDTTELATLSDRGAGIWNINATVRVWASTGFNFTNVGQTYYSRVTDLLSDDVYLISYTVKSLHQNNTVRVTKRPGAKTDLPWVI